VETIIFTALERRASDIHIEARDAEVAVKYRIDGVLQHAMQPIAKEWHSTVLSRIKVLSDLDIAERRVPQDGRFRVKYKGRYIDLRVSIMPASHGKTPCCACWTRKRFGEIPELEPGRCWFSTEEVKRFAGTSASRTHGAGDGPTGSGKRPRCMRQSTRLSPTKTRSSPLKTPSNTSFAALRRFP